MIKDMTSLEKGYGIFLIKKTFCLASTCYYLYIIKRPISCFDLKFLCAFVGVVDYTTFHSLYNMHACKISTLIYL